MRNRMRVQINVWKSVDGWHWNAVRSGQVIAESGRCYSTRYACLKTLAALTSSIADGLVTTNIK